MEMNAISESIPLVKNQFVEPEAGRLKIPQVRDSVPSLQPKPLACIWINQKTWNMYESDISFCDWGWLLCLIGNWFHFRLTPSYLSPIDYTTENCRVRVLQGSSHESVIHTIVGMLVISLVQFVGSHIYNHPKTRENCMTFGPGLRICDVSRNSILSILVSLVSVFLMEDENIPWHWGFMCRLRVITDCASSHAPLYRNTSSSIIYMRE